MEWQHTPFTIPLIVSGIGTIILAMFVAQRRRVPEARTLMVLMSAVVLWTLFYALELGSGALTTKLFWAKAKYLGIVIVPPTWLVLARQYTRKEKAIGKGVFVLFCVMALTNLALVWTNEAHHLYWASVSIKDVGPFTVLALPMGPGFWLCAAYDYILVLIGTLLFLEAFIRSHHLFRWQTGAILVAAIAPWMGNIIFLAGWSPYPHTDLTPFGFVIACLLGPWALFRLRLIDLVPVAHAAIVDGITDCVIVLDHKDRIVEFNPSARKLMEISVEDVIGKTLEKAAPALNSQLNPADRVATAGEEIMLGKANSRRIYDATLSPLTDRGRITCKVIVLRDTTEHKEAEDKIQSQNRFLETVLESLTHPFYVLDVEDYTIKLANSAAKLGDLSDNPTCYSLTHKNNMPCGALGHPCPLNQVKKTKKSVSMDHVHHMEDGTRQHIQINGYPILDDDGNVTQIIEYNLDITERRQMEEALRQSEARFRTAVESLPFDFFIIDENGRYAMQNSACWEHWGDIVGKRPEDVAPNEKTQQLWKKQNERAFGGEVVQGEVRLKSGKKEASYHNIISPIWSGDEIEGILGVNIDITERKKAEEALRKSEELFRTLADTIPYGIQEINASGVITFANSALCEMYGYSKEELEGSTIFELPAEEAERVELRNYLESLVKEQPEPTPYFGTGLTKTGETIDVQVDWNYRRRKDGGVAGFVVVITDITEKKKAEEKIRLLSSAVEQSTEGLAVVDLEGFLIFSNKAFASAHGYEPAELYGKHLSIFHTPDQMAFVESANITLQEKGVFRGEVWHVRRDGSTFPALMQNSVLCNDGGEPTGMIGTLQDISEQKRLRKNCENTGRSWKSL